MRPAPLSLAASATSSRSWATYSSPAFCACCCAPSSTRTISGVNCGCPAPPPETFGWRPTSRSTACLALAASPPAARISPAAAPCSSSSSAFSRCSGVTRWWYSRMAMVCAACRKPLARSVNFSMSILLVPPLASLAALLGPPAGETRRQLMRPPRIAATDSIMVAPDVVIRLALGQEPEELIPMRVEHIYRYPVKGLTAEALEEVALREGECLPHDRRFALAQGDAPFDPAAPTWLQKRHFGCLMANAQARPAAQRLRRPDRPAADPPAGRRRPCWPIPAARPAAPRSPPSSPASWARRPAAPRTSSRRRATISPMWPPRRCPSSAWPACMPWNGRPA